MVGGSILNMCLEGFKHLLFFLFGLKDLLKQSKSKFGLKESEAPTSSNSLHCLTETYTYLKGGVADVSNMLMARPLLPEKSKQ